jgi:hypothetical protein
MNEQEIIEQEINEQEIIEEFYDYRKTLRNRKDNFEFNDLENRKFMGVLDREFNIFYFKNDTVDYLGIDYINSLFNEYLIDYCFNIGFQYISFIDNETSNTINIVYEV